MLSEHHELGKRFLDALGVPKDLPVVRLTVTFDWQNSAASVELVTWPKFKDAGSLVEELRRFELKEITDGATDVEGRFSGSSDANSGSD